MKNTVALLLLSIAGLQAHAQTDAEHSTIEQKINALTDDVTDLKNDKLKRSQLKLTGYIQAQYQVADTDGITSFAGGNFAPGQDKRFMIRRGRVTLDYSRLNDDGDIMTQGVVQVDYSQNGLILRDAYVNILDPWTKWIGLKVGAMNRPFGYEVVYGDDVRETPERGMMSQTLFPGEKDLGAQIYLMPNKTSRFRFFKLEAGMYNGTGVNNIDFDKYKDFISHLGFYKNNEKETIRYSGGVSYYNGGHRNGNRYLDVLQTAPNGEHFWMVTDSSAINATKKGKQIYYGIDAQVSVHWAAGLTTLRGEYIQGTQAGTAAISATPRDVVTGNTFQRNFNGAYFYFVQNIANTRHNVVVKYDWYDPNTDVKGNEIGAVSTSTADGKVSLTAADIKYSTLGLGYFFNYDQNWKFMVYADIVKNESTKLADFGSDLKDNVLTIRVQYKF